MPYVERSVRKVLLEDNTPEDAGELNYLITKLCDSFLRAKGRRYNHINTVIGVLECAKQEFYRRIAAPYENEKIAENGDVYSADNMPPPGGFVTLPDALTYSTDRLDT